ncbi:hypothetical protein [Streptomyces sp. H27-C3]|uniref:hypothetical protein n=1 Tax=Streptomyces sp. H27-C3 TaxID=3046305 RepID=UPI0024BA142D|nr:hypothetical protein [Streptomyces sp. H27-C3]MDJ0466638.1 hypothetical protein [Streptomyces sp. H27-C3]
MPSVLGLMERREARARQDLESWTEVLEQAQAEVDAARERVERARVGREELMSVLAGESTVNTPVSVPSGGEAAAGVGSSGSGAGHGGQPPVWRSGMGGEALSGLYREVFAAVVAASGPVNGVELTRAVGREAEIKNEVEKIRHRAYVLERRGWLVREKDGRFTPAAVGRGASPAGAERPRPSGATA